MGKKSGILIGLLLLGSSVSLKANDNPIMKTYPHSILEVLIEKPKDESTELQRPLPLKKIPFKQRTDKYISIGTAWFSNSKQLFSAAHVFTPDSSFYTSNFYVRNVAGEVFPVDSVVIYSNKYDIVAFTLKKYPDKIIPIPLTSKYAIGDDVCAPGNALGEGISMRCGGQISSLNPEPANGEWKEIYFSTPVSPGNSGGPLLDSRGSAIGIVIRKIQGEDMNIAIPFNEIKKVKSKIEFAEKEVGLKDSSIPALTVKKDFRVSAVQALSMMAWMQTIVEGLNNHILKMSSTYNAIWAKSGILMDKKAKDYFMSPKKNPYFSLVKYTSDANTEITADTGKFQEFKNLKRSLVMQVIGNQLMFLIDSNKDEKAGALSKNPKEIMDTLLSTGQFIKRKIADEEIPYKSIGEPYSQLPMIDVLGRAWVLMRWRIKEMQMDLAIACTNRPSGTACILLERSGLQSDEVLASIYKTNLAELNLGYYGTSRQWLEFLALPANEKPEFMSELRISKEDRQIEIFTPEINIVSQTYNKVADDLVLSYSYEVRKPFKMVPYAISYYPNVAEKILVTAAKVYRSGTSPKDKSEWSYLTSGKKPFDGGVYETKDGMFMATEIVERIGNNCVIIGTVAGENEQFIKRFKQSLSFENLTREELAH